MKKHLLYTLCGLIFFLLLSVSCSSWFQYGDAVLVENYSCIDDLIRDTPVVVIGYVDGENTEFPYGKATFILTKFRVEEAVRGAVDDTINILQTKIKEDPMLNNGDRMVLFLTKYNGPMDVDAYRIKGLYQGQYTLEGTECVKNEANKLTGDELLENIDRLISQINTVGYAPLPASEPPSEE